MYLITGNKEKDYSQPFMSQTKYQLIKGWLYVNALAFRDNSHNHFVTP